MPYQTWVSATAVLIAAVPVATAAAADGATQSAHPPTPSVYAVSIRLRSGDRTLTVQGYADTARQTADLTTRLPDEHNVELRLVAGEAYVHIDPAAPWLSIDPSALGIPVRALWAVAAARHLTVKIGPEYATTLTVNVTPAGTARRAVQAPSGAVGINGSARDLVAVLGAELRLTGGNGYLNALAGPKDW